MEITIDYITPQTQLRLMKQNEGKTLREVSTVLLEAECKLGNRVVRNNIMKRLGEKR